LNVAGNAETTFDIEPDVRKPSVPIKELDDVAPLAYLPRGQQLLVEDKS